MKTPQIKKLFAEAFKGKNFMTPVIICYGKSGEYIYEISRGEFLGRDIFGVTVLKLDGEGTHKTELGKPFGTQVQAETYARSLGGE